LPSSRTFALATVLSLASLWIACSSTLPVRVPVNKRIRVVVEPLRDLTGDYDAMGESLETLTSRKLKDDYAHRLFESGYPKSVYTEFITNSFMEAPHGIETTTTVDGQGPILRLSGTVEQIVYGRPQDVEEYIVNTWMLEVWGLLVSGSDDSAGFVEYRVSVDDARSGEHIKTLLVQGGFRQEEADREHIIGLANKVATEALVYQLNKEIAPLVGVEPKTAIWQGTKVDEYPSSLREPGEFE